MITFQHKNIFTGSVCCRPSNTEVTLAQYINLQDNTRTKQYNISRIDVLPNSEALIWQDYFKTTSLSYDISTYCNF